MHLYEQIKRDNVTRYGTEASRIMKIIINQYSDRTHFIYELLQNAEDADATYIKFHLYQDKLVVIHNGRPFNENDIIGICGIADGTKEDGSRIGHFGIGFKSVYAYTMTPNIYSGDYSFVIEDQLFPKMVSPIKNIATHETCMILPFNRDDVSASVAFKEISIALVKKITGESIIMLNTIADITIEIDGNPEIIEINMEKGKLDSNDNVFELSLLVTVTNQVTGQIKDNTSEYLYFTDAEKEATAIVFKVEGKELQSIRNSKIYAYFPTAKESHQNFYIHAPFETTPARDNFKEGADYGKHNIELIKSIGKLIYYSFLWIRNNGYLSISGLNKVFPIYEYEEDDMLYCIYKNSIDIINNNEKLLPTNSKGQFKGINDICVPSNMSIVNVFDDDDLHYLEKDHQKYWIAKEITTSEYSNFKKFLDVNFKLKTYEWKDLVLKMDARFLEGKPLSWIEKLIGGIESFCIRRGYEQSTHFIDVSNIPFIRLTDGKHICAKINDKPQIYLNNPSNCNYRIDSSFRKNAAIRSFCNRALGIFDYDVVTETLDKILPKYNTKQVQFKTSNPIRENIEDLKEVKDAIYTNPSVLDVVNDKYIVTDGKDWYKPGELFIKSDDVRTGYSLVKEFVKIRFLSSQYYDDTVMIKLDSKFFQEIGCILGLKVVEATRDEYLDQVKKHCGYKVSNELYKKIFSKNYIAKKISWSFNYMGFPDVFSKMTIRKSLELAKFLNKNINNFDIQGELFAADDQHFSGANVDSMQVYTMLGLQLSYEKWIYINNDSEPQRPIDVNRNQIHSDYNVVKRLMDMLPFKKTEDALSKWLDENIVDQSSRRLVEKLFSEPEKLTDIAKTLARDEAKREAKDANTKKGDILEKIKNGTREQKGERTDSRDRPDISSISEKGLQKRRENLDDELAASLDNKVKVTRGLRFVSRACNSDERAFLEEQYEGYCQICYKKIVKHDGKNYFEAINIIKQNELNDKYLDGLKLAWNSLCLCPNCAAEYNHCSKSIPSIYEQVMQKDVIPNSDKPIDINIELPKGTQKQIHYSPRHYLALKEALKTYTND